MKAWQETTLIYSEIARLFEQRMPSALATLIKIEGSSYRRPGAKLLIRQDGSMAGNVSGGCLESDLRERAQRVMKSGKAELVHYDTGGDEDTVWGLGLGCNGHLDLLLQPSPPGNDPALVSQIVQRLSGREPFALCTLIDGAEAGRTWIYLDNELLAKEKSYVEEKPEGRVFVDILRPPPDLIIIGAGDDAAPLVRIAADAGFRVTLVDHRPAYLSKDLFPSATRLLHARPEAGLGELPVGPDTFVVIKNHALTLDREWTNLFAAAPGRYVGLLGPKARRDEIIGSLSEAQRVNLYGPVGLDIGADGAEQIALSIVSEMLAVRAGRHPGHLRDRKKGLHG